MKVTGWTDLEDGRYPHDPADDSMETFIEARNAVIDEIRKHGYKFSGIYHQDGMTGVPIIDDNWLFGVSQRSWGQIMAEAYPDQVDDSDGYGYITWAWMAPEPMVIPKEEEYAHVN